MKIGDDVFLSDHTVSYDDPRIVDALESINRIRNRTGFDPSLIKDRVWANKVSKDLIHGLAVIDKIGLEKRRRELSFVRNIEAEKFLLSKRLDSLSRNLVTVNRHRQRSKSLNCVNSSLVSAYESLHQSVNNLKYYTAQLEAQGGFIIDFRQEEKTSAEPIPDDVILKANKKRVIRGAKSNSLPQIDNPQFGRQHLISRPKIFSVYRQLITQPGSTRVVLQVRSPSLPSIQVGVAEKPYGEVRRSGYSVPNNLVDCFEEIEPVIKEAQTP